MMNVVISLDDELITHILADDLDEELKAKHDHCVMLCLERMLAMKVFHSSQENIVKCLETVQPRISFFYRRHRRNRQIIERNRQVSFCISKYHRRNRI